MSEQANQDAVQALLNAALAPKKALDLDELDKAGDKGQAPDEYVEVTVTRRYGGGPDRGGRQGTTSWRVTTRYVSRSSKDNARLLKAKTTAALEFAELSVDGGHSTPVQFESGEPIGPDDGWWSGLDTWTYSL